MNVPVNEQETVITMVRDDNFAKIYTADTTVMTKLDKLVAEAPETWKLVSEDEYGKTYRCPKKMISFRAKAVKRELSNEQREELADRMRKTLSAMKDIPVQIIKADE